MPLPIVLTGLLAACELVTPSPAADPCASQAAHNPTLTPGEVRAHRLCPPTSVLTYRMEGETGPRSLDLLVRHGGGADLTVEYMVDDPWLWFQTILRTDVLQTGDELLITVGNGSGLPHRFDLRASDTVVYELLPTYQPGRVEFEPNSNGSPNGIVGNEDIYGELSGGDTDYFKLIGADDGTRSYVFGIEYLEGTAGEIGVEYTFDPQWPNGGNPFGKYLTWYASPGEVSWFQVASSVGREHWLKVFGDGGDASYRLIPLSSPDYYEHEFRQERNSGCGDGVTYGGFVQGTADYDIFSCASTDGSRHVAYHVTNDAPTGGVGLLASSGGETLLIPAGTTDVLRVGIVHPTTPSLRLDLENGGFGDVPYQMTAMFGREPYERGGVVGVLAGEAIYGRLPNSGDVDTFSVSVPPEGAANLVVDIALEQDRTIELGLPGLSEEVGPENLPLVFPVGGRSQIEATLRLVDGDFGDLQYSLTLGFE